MAATVRLRQCGLGPWLGFLGWASFCVGQEPAALRTFGIWLRDPAIWTAASGLWLIFAVAKTTTGGGVVDRFALGAFLLLLVLAVTATVLLLACLVTGDPRWADTVRQAGWWLLAWIPVSLALACPRSSSFSPVERAVTKALVVAALGPAITVSMAPWLAFDRPTLFAASGLSIGASLLLMIATGGYPGPRVAPRKQT